MVAIVKNLSHLGATPVHDLHSFQLPECWNTVKSFLKLPPHLWSLFSGKMWNWSRCFTRCFESLAFACYIVCRGGGCWIFKQEQHQQIDNFQKNLHICSFTTYSTFIESLTGLSQTHNTVLHIVLQTLGPFGSFRSLAAINLFRLHLENVWVLLLQNGSRTQGWQGPPSPATLPTSRRPTGTLRQDLQSLVQWDKNVSSNFYPVWNLLLLVCVLVVLLTVSYNHLKQVHLLECSLCFPKLPPQDAFACQAPVNESLNDWSQIQLNLYV